MKRLVGGLVCIALVGIALSFIGSTSVTAKRAYADKGNGCYVRTGEGPADYVIDPNCEAHDVVKEDDEGNLELYFYQDHGQTSWHPEETYRNTYEDCLNSQTYGQICGIVKETVTPSGEYKSSFKSF